MQNRKLALSSIEFILVVLYKKELTFTLEVEEAEKCARIIFIIVNSLSANIKNFERERTLTETIFHQMIRYYFLISAKLINMPALMSFLDGFYFISFFVLSSLFPFPLFGLYP